MLWKCCARRPVGFKLKTHLVWGLGEDHVLAYLVLSSQRRRENVFNSHLHILKGRPEQWSQLLHHHIHLHLHLHESQLINILYKGDMKHIVKKKKKKKIHYSTYETNFNLDCRNVKRPPKMSGDWAAKWRGATYSISGTGWSLGK